MPIVLGCARLEPNKDFSTLLRAFAIVLKHRPAKLVILGDGSEKEALQKLSVALAIDSDVTFAGFVSDPQRWMADADVFVSTSRTEGFPNALMEAVASACPVVATASSDAVSEILDQGRLGRIVPVGDVEAVAREIVEALERSPFSTNPEAHLSRYSLPRIATQYLAVLTGECSATA